MKRCRSCEIDAENYTIDAFCGISDFEMPCPLCGYVGQRILHSSKSYDGYSLECRNCNDYILYFDGQNQIYKDEIYLSDNECLIRDVEHGESAFHIFNEFKNYSFNGIIQFNDLASLKEKLKRFLIFV